MSPDDRAINSQYFPILEIPEPMDPRKPNGRQRYRGVSMPIMVIDDQPGDDESEQAGSSFRGPRQREHEAAQQLPPIVADHSHDHSGHGHGSVHQHQHDGRVHRHRV